MSQTMKRALVAVAAALVTDALAGIAAADPALVSAPLKGGAGGVVCACANLSAGQITVDYQLATGGGGYACGNVVLLPGGFPGVCSVSSDVVRICRVTRDDGKPPSPKQLACTFTAYDATGNPVAVVPVDKKLK